MLCYICGSNKAQIRKCELEIAKITLRAHVDCNGHSHYRCISQNEFWESLEYYMDNPELGVANEIQR